MALLGGAGNPVGGSFTGPAEGLEIIGDHAYAYSGTFESTTAEQTMMSFTTGNFYTVGTFTFNGPVRIAFAGSGGTAAYQISFNGQVVALGNVDTVTSNTPPAQNQLQEVVMPPYTEVTLTAVCGEDTATELITATYTGRIYRT